MTVVLRPAGADDVDTCVAVQRASTTVGYAHIFDQTVYPFPEAAIREEWVSRLASNTAVTIAVDDGDAVGVVGTTRNRLEALFVVPDRWGLGIANLLHDQALSQIAAGGYPHAVLDALAENVRARAFYERRGWALSGQPTRSPWPPFPEIVTYRRRI